MSAPTNFEGTTHHFGPPPGVPETECGWMHVYSNGVSVVSAWQPSPEALEALRRGEPLFVVHQSGMLPGTDCPLVFPTFAGSKAEALGVVERTGATWE